MNPLTMVSQNFKSIVANPARSFLTVLGIVIGIAAIISLLGISRVFRSRSPHN